MTKGTLAIALTAATILHAGVRADEPAGSKALAATKFELANGLRVFVLEDHQKPTLAVVTWFRVGSKD